MLALIAAVALLNADAGEVTHPLSAFSLEPASKPGSFVLAAREDGRVRLTVEVTPWPPPQGITARAELELSCDPEVVLRALAVLEKGALEPRTNARPATLDGPAALPARIAAVPKDGATLKLDFVRAQLVLDPKNAVATFEGLDATLLRQVEAMLQGTARRPGPTARLIDIEAIAGPGAEPVWSGRRGVLYLAGNALKLWDSGSGKSRALGTRALAPLAATCTGEICALAESRTRISVVAAGDGLENIELPKPLSLLNVPLTRVWLSPDARWVGGEVQASADDERQHLWFFDRKAKKHLTWERPGDTSHALTYSTWGSRGVLFWRTAPCRDGDSETAADVACLFELETGKLSPVGNARRAPPDVTSPDRVHRLSHASVLPVIEQLDGGGEVVRISTMGGLTPMSAVWISNAALLGGVDPLETVDLKGATRRVIEDRLQFAGGQLDGARVWYQTAEGIFAARVVSAH
jgi:hypothetical protein